MFVFFLIFSLLGMVSSAVLNRGISQLLKECVTPLQELRGQESTRLSAFTAALESVGGTLQMENRNAFQQWAKSGTVESRGGF